MKGLVTIIGAIILAVLLVLMMPEALLGPVTKICGTVVLVYCLGGIVDRLKRLKES